MAATRNEFLQGKAKWAKLVTPDNRYGSAWKLQLYLTPDSLKTFEALKAEGVLNVLKKDDDGYSIALKRPTQVQIRGVMQGLSPPEVLEADGKTVLRNALVGNGSDVTCKVQVYSYHRATDPQGTRGGRAMRLESVRVDHLVPFEMQRDFDEEQQRQTRGLPEAPPQPMF